MSLTHRRSFLVRSASAAALLGTLRAEPLRRSNLGVQLYTLREILPQDPGKTLRALRDIGYAELEVVDGPTYNAVMHAVPAGLKPVSIHLPTAQLKASDDSTKAKFATFHKAGFRYAVYPYVDVKERGGADVYKRMAEKFDRMGAIAKDAGLTFCYHNHAFDFEPMDGTTPLEIFLKGASEDHLSLELDMFWVTVAGLNPVEVLEKHSGRVKLLHVKNRAKGSPSTPQYNETVPHEMFKEADAGEIDVPKVLSAADKAGVEHYFVEQDQSPDPMASLRQSFTYLSKLESA